MHGEQQGFVLGAGTGFAGVNGQNGEKCRMILHGNCRLNLLRDMKCACLSIFWLLATAAMELSFENLPQRLYIPTQGDFRFHLVPIVDSSSPGRHDVQASPPFPTKIASTLVNILVAGMACMG